MIRNNQMRFLNIDALSNSSNPAQLTLLVIWNRACMAQGISRNYNCHPFSVYPSNRRIICIIPSTLVWTHTVTSSTMTHLVALKWKTSKLTSSFGRPARSLVLTWFFDLQHREYNDFLFDLGSSGSQNVEHNARCCDVEGYVCDTRCWK